MARGKVIEEMPVFAVIQPASVPLKPQNSRAKVLIIWTFLGFALSTAWVLYGKEYWEKLFLKKSRTNKRKTEPAFSPQQAKGTVFHCEAESPLYFVYVYRSREMPDDRSCIIPNLT